MTEIVGESNKVVDGKRGALLRRQDPNQECSSTGKRRLLETFLPIDLDSKIEKEKLDVEMCFRWVEFDCSKKTPMELQATAIPFDICVGRIVQVLKDP